MSDFYQTGVIATFHRLGSRPIEDIETELEVFADHKPMALILPSLYSELQRPALRGIVDKLMDARYLHSIVVSLDVASKREFLHAKEYFSALPQNKRIVWNDGPAMQRVYKTIKSAELPMGHRGKGQSVWMSYGYVMSQQKIEGIVLHDCDIVTYDRSMLARLCYPIMNPALNYDFCKGFYSRVTDRLHGRVTRLLVTPLIRSLQKIIGYHPILVFFDSFRYPLAGEFSIDVDLARSNRIPGDWGLEVGVLAEVYRNTSIKRVCQIDIAENYEHKHQALSPADSSKGLHKMCVDICKSIFRTLGSEGIVYSDGFFKTLLAAYVRTAQDMLDRYQNDAAVNGLFFDRHAESLAIETFTQAIRKASEAIIEDPLGAPLIAAWDRVISAIPDILEKINEAVEEDNS